jgi:hypothetical protein
MAMDHQYIDANAVAERYLGNRLGLREREDFERHLVDCQECADRLLLAGMFHARMGNGVPPAPGATGGTARDEGAPNGPGAFKQPREVEASDALSTTRELHTSPELDTPPESKPYAGSEPPALFVRVKPLQLLWILLISAFLLVAIPALVWEIFEGYLER